MVAPRTHHLLLLVFGAIAAAVTVSFVLVRYGEIPQLRPVELERLAGGVVVTYYPETADAPTEFRRFPGRVDVASDYEPLQNVLRELAKKAKYKMVLTDTDGRPDRYLPYGHRWMTGGDEPPREDESNLFLEDEPINLSPSKEEMYLRPITMVLKNVEVETAVRLLTEQVGLAAFRHRDDLWVSTKETVCRWLEVNPRGYLRAVPQPPRRVVAPLIPSANASPKRR